MNLLALSPPAAPPNTLQMDFDNLFVGHQMDFHEEEETSRLGMMASRGVSGGPKDEHLASLIPDDLIMDSFSLSQPDSINRSSTPLTDIVDNFRTFEDEDLFTAELF